MFSSAASQKTGRSNRERNIEKRISNIEQGISNIEVRYSIINILKIRLSAAIPHFIIRNFLFDILRFAVQAGCSFIRKVQGTGCASRS